MRFPCIIKSDELNLLFNEVRPEKYKMFLKMVYFTGARVGEIRTFQPHQIYDDYIEVNGKSGLRIIKLNEQAQDVLKSVNELWNYLGKNFLLACFVFNINKNYNC